jgi:hypothetical protein
LSAIDSTAEKKGPIASFDSISDASSDNFSRIESLAVLSIPGKVANCESLIAFYSLSSSFAASGAFKTASTILVAAAFALSHSA